MSSSGTSSTPELAGNSGSPSSYAQRQPLVGRERGEWEVRECAVECWGRGPEGDSEKSPLVAAVARISQRSNKTLGLSGHFLSLFLSLKRESDW